MHTTSWTKTEKNDAYEIQNSTNNWISFEGMKLMIITDWKTVLIPWEKIWIYLNIVAICQNTLFLMKINDEQYRISTTQIKSNANFGNEQMGSI